MNEPAASPATGRRTRKRRQLTDRVAATAFELFKAQGYDAVTMEQVAAAADIAKGTLYKYFPLKEALLAHQFQQEIASGTALLWPLLERQGSFAAQMSCLLQSWAQWHEARRGYLAHYLRHQFSSPGLDRHAGRQRPPSNARQTLERLCRAAQQRGDVRTDLSAAQIAVQLECLCLGAILSWLARPDARLLHEFDAVLLMALKGVGVPSSAAARQH